MGCLRKRGNFSAVTGWLTKGSLGTLHPAFTSNPLTPTVLMEASYVSYT